MVTLSTGLEDPERVTVALLVGGAALQQGNAVTMFLSKGAVRLAVAGVAEGVACEGCPPLPRLFEQYAEGGGELLACLYCIDARARSTHDGLMANARVAGATPLLESIGAGATVFSY